MDLLGLPDIFTTDTTLTRVRAVPLYSFGADTLEALNLIRPTTRPTIGILPSGLPWIKKSLKKGEFLSGSFLTSRYKRSRPQSANNVEVHMDKQIGKTSPKVFHQHIYSVPYSDHSNFEELEDFIKLVKPTDLKGIVSISTCFIEPMYYFGRLCTGNQPVQVQQLHDRFKMKETDEIKGAVCPETSSEDDDVELNRSKESYKVKESGKRVATVSPETSSSEEDSVELDRNKMKALKVKLSGFRMRRFSALRRTRRGAKSSDLDYFDPDEQMGPS